MAEFTKGKWIIDRDGIGIFSDSEDCYVAEISPANSDEQMRANARLIAVAPEMYNFLHDLVVHKPFIVGIHGICGIEEEYMNNICRVLKRIDGKEANYG